MKNVLDKAIESGQFTVLVDALREAGLDDILSSDGPFTIFAPTDEAFSKLPKKAIENLLHDKERLTEILTYHVIYDTFKYKDVVKMKNAKTVQGTRIIFDISNKTKVNKATIIKSDIECENGVIHIIDEVLIPI